MTCNTAMWIIHSTVATWSIIRMQFNAASFVFYQWRLRHLKLFEVSWLTKLMFRYSKATTGSVLDLCTHPIFIWVIKVHYRYITKLIDSRARTAGCKVVMNVDDILLKGPYPPCLRMADRAFLAGYPRYVLYLPQPKALVGILGPLDEYLDASMK